MQEKAQCLVEIGITFKLAADTILPNRADNGLFFKHGFVLVAQLKVNLHHLILLNGMQAGDGEAQPAAREIMDVDDATADPSLAENLIGTVQAGLFAVMTTEIEQNGKDLVATAAYGKYVALVAVTPCVKMFDRPAGRADQGSAVIFADVDFNLSHGAQS